MVDGHTANHDGVSYPSLLPVPVSITGGVDNDMAWPVRAYPIS
jgi:hypothetical protein